MHPDEPDELTTNVDQGPTTTSHRHGYVPEFRLEHTCDTTTGELPGRLQIVVRVSIRQDLGTIRAELLGDDDIRRNALQQRVELVCVAPFVKEIGGHQPQTMAHRAGTVTADQPDTTSRHRAILGE